jgi:hypothetical protein
MKSKGRMKFKGSGVRPSSIPEDSPFAKYYEGGWIPIPSRKKHHCSEGYHWVKRYKTKNGFIIKGHCAKDPWGKYGHPTRRPIKRQKDKQKYKAYCVYTTNGKRLKLKQINPSSLEESFKMVKEKFHQLVDNCKIDEKFKQRNR